MNKEMKKKLRMTLQVHRGRLKETVRPRQGAGALPMAFHCQDALRTRFTEKWCKKLITGEHVCYLPLDDTVPGYDRDRILKMILIHDLAESKTGDIINKTDAEVRAESCWFAQTTNLSTYSDLTGIGELSELWGEFEGQSTINARIAKDFDRFDQLTQLYIYQRQVPDFVSWRKELLSGMVTEQGRRVLKVVTSHFDAG